jgi:hypothetical protein
MSPVTRPLFKYPGSKWQLSKHYPEPQCAQIIEPFAGSACYSLRHADRYVLLVDNNQDVVDLWTYLIQADGSTIANLPLDLEIGYDIRNLDVSYGAQLLIRAWQRVGSNTCWTVSKWGNLPGQWTRSTRDAVARNIEHIRHWRVEHGDYSRIRRGRATWFVDPPYQSLPLFGSKLIDYDYLSRWCRSLPGQTIVCERAQSEPWLPFKPFREVVTGRRGASSKGKSQEVIWTQGCTDAGV